MLLTSSPTPARPPLGARQRGVTLIELLVGLGIGLVAIALITSVVLVYEGQKRTTTAGSDAQVNAALALNTLQRDVQMSGFGLTTGGGAGCLIKLTRAGTAVPDLTLAPVRIDYAATGGTAALTVLMSGKQNFAMPVRVYEDHRRDASEFVLDPNTNLGNAVGDLMLAVPSATAGTQVSPNWCSVFSISSTTGDRIAHVADASNPWNQDNTATIFPGSLNADISYAAGSSLINLGQPAQFIVRRYSLGEGHLRAETLNMGTGAMGAPELIYPNVVDLQAVYGKDTDADGTVNTWERATPTTAALWAQVIAVRIAVVTRSEQYEGKPDQPATVVTSSEPSWTPDGSTAETLGISTRVSCASGESDCWKHYRYKVFETVVPLRNMLWKS
jgi:type IV pilus assembly protein PilW